MYMYVCMILQMIYGLKTKRRILLTGTPIQVSRLFVSFYASLVSVQSAVRMERWSENKSHL